MEAAWENLIIIKYLLRIPRETTWQIQNSVGLQRSAQIYIDSHLGDGIQGEMVAKEIQGQGFTQPFLATGFSPSRFGQIDWIEKIVGKEPPWDDKKPCDAQETRMTV